MATRRPKVPRADALDRPAQKNADGGDVIRADFGDSRKVTAGQEAPARGTTPKEHRPGGKPAAGNSYGGSHAKAKTSPAKSTARPGTPKSGTPKSGTAKPATERPGPGIAAGTSPVPAKAFSGRMLALAVVMIAITLLLAPTVKIYLEKKAEISSLQADIADKQAEQAALQKQITRWQDPNYVKQQARDRINMVMPGEASYWVFGGDVPAGTPGGTTGSGTSGSPGNLPWVDGLWESIKRSATD